MDWLNGLHKYAADGCWLKSIRRMVTEILCREEGFVDMSDKDKGDQECCTRFLWKEHSGHRDGDLGAQIHRRGSHDWDISKVVQKTAFYASTELFSSRYTRSRPLLCPLDPSRALRLLFLAFRVEESVFIILATVRPLSTAISDHLVRIRINHSAEPSE